jgi:hypothetical protein
MNFEDDAMSEMVANVLSVKGPHLNLSNPAKVCEQTRPLHEYYEEPEENLPLAVIYIDGESYSLVANDCYEISLTFDISLVYKFTEKEGRKKALARGKQCLMQIYRQIFDRQKNGALAIFHTIEKMDMSAVNHDNIDGNNFVAVATAKYTLNQREVTNA